MFFVVFKVTNIIMPLLLPNIGLYFGLIKKKMTAFIVYTKIS